MFRSVAPVVVLLVGAVCCGAGCGGGASEPPSTSSDSASVSSDVVEAPVPADPPAASPVSSAGAGGGVRWGLSRRPRPIDGLFDVVAFRPPTSVSGPLPPDVAVFARCIGDRTEVEMVWRVPLGDDVIGDGRRRSKRVLVRFPPQPVRPVLWTVSTDGAGLFVSRPLDFLREWVVAHEVLIQTTAGNGAVLFAAFARTEALPAPLVGVASACRWTLDPELAEAELAAVVESVEARERAEVLESYLDVPLFESLDVLRAADGRLYVDLPAPVGPAYLGEGFELDELRTFFSAGAPLVCPAGRWEADELVLLDCFPELDADRLEGFAAEQLDRVGPEAIEPPAR